MSSYQDIREYLVQCTVAIYFYLYYNVYCTHAIISSNTQIQTLDFRSKDLAILGEISGATFEAIFEIFFGLFWVDVLGKHWNHVFGYFFRLFFLR